MKFLPEDLALRLKDIFSKEEIKVTQRAFSLEKRPVTFRLNTLKSTQEEVDQALSQASITYTKLDFPKNCYLLDDNFSEADLWKRRIYKDWGIYIQGISSQLPINLFHSEDSNNLKILDATAAPWGKTSQLSEKYPNAEIYAFEPSKIRYDKMCHNLEKLWCTNVTMIHNSIENISTHISGKNYFDLVIIDAPCSGEWSISKYNEKFLEAWNISHIGKNYKRQKRICDSVIPYLKEDWELIYSTCTLAPEENEAVIHYLLCNYPELSLEKIDFMENKYINKKEALKSFGKHPYKKEISQCCLRVIPSEFSEWFFIAKIKKWVL